MFPGCAGDRVDPIRVGSVSEWSLPLPAACGASFRETSAPGGRVPITVVRYRIIDEEDLWVPSSRSAASACRRRSTARCFAVPASSGGSSASREPSVRHGPAILSSSEGRRGPRFIPGSTPSVVSVVSGVSNVVRVLCDPYVHLLWREVVEPRAERPAGTTSAPGQVESGIGCCDPASGCT